MIPVGEIAVILAMLSSQSIHFLIYCIPEDKEELVSLKL